MLARIKMLLPTREEKRQQSKTYLAGTLILDFHPPEL